MHPIEIILIAISLALDSFAVSVCSGIIVDRVNTRMVLKIAIYMGGFQAIMPTVGWLLAVSVKQYIQAFDHWIAFGLLSILGVKMIHEYFKKDCNVKYNPTKHLVLLGLAIATSIDALIMGVNFALLELNLVFTIFTIGITAFIFSFVGVYLGDKFGNKFDFRAELIGGIVLIGIGTKILIEHLVKGI